MATAIVLEYERLSDGSQALNLTLQDGDNRITLAPISENAGVELAEALLTKTLDGVSVIDRTLT